MYSCFDLLSAGSVKLDVTIAPGTGKFEVCENSTLVASGCVNVASDDELESNEADSEVHSCPALRLNGDDVYKELRLRGYDYGPSFRGVVSADGNGMQIVFSCVFKKLCNRHMVCI